MAANSGQVVRTFRAEGSSRWRKAGSDAHPGLPIGALQSRIERLVLTINHEESLLALWSPHPELESDAAELAREIREKRKALAAACEALRRARRPTFRM